MYETNKKNISRVALVKHPLLYILILIKLFIHIVSDHSRILTYSLSCRKMIFWCFLSFSAFFIDSRYHYWVTTFKTSNSIELNSLEESIRLDVIFLPHDGPQIRILCVFLPLVAQNMSSWSALMSCLVRPRRYPIHVDHLLPGYHVDHILPGYHVNIFWGTLKLETVRNLMSRPSSYHCLFYEQVGSIIWFKINLRS